MNEQNSVGFWDRAIRNIRSAWEKIASSEDSFSASSLGPDLDDEDRAKLKEELEDVHTLFKGLVGEQRPSLDIERVATGEHWYGTHALELGLIDEIGTSDDYLMSAAGEADIYTVMFKGKQTLQERIMSTFESSLDRAGIWLEERLSRNMLP